MSSFTVSCAFAPSTSYINSRGIVKPKLARQASLLPFRSDLDMQHQRVKVQAEREIVGASRHHQNEISCRRRPEDELHHLRTLVITAVARQQERGSIGLSLTVERATSRNLTRDVYTQEQVQEATEILNNSGAFNMSYIVKTLLADVEMLYHNHGYAAAMRAFNQLRPWDLVFPAEPPVPLYYYSSFAKKGDSASASPPPPLRMMNSRRNAVAESRAL